VGFVLVYIDEAHAQDEWPISSSRFNGNRGAVNLQQTHTLRDRTRHAHAFASDFGFDHASGVRMLVDDPECGGSVSSSVNGGDFQQAFSPWPIRMYILQGGCVRYVSEPGTNSDIEVQPFANTLRLTAARESF